MLYERIHSSVCLWFYAMSLLFFRTDPHLPDMPIVYASDEFLKLTGAQN